MTAEDHNRTLATLHFIYGAMHGLTLAGLLLLVVVVELATPAASSISTFWIALGVLTFVVLLLVVGLVPLVVGYALQRQRKWAKVAGIIAGVVAATSFPIGTAVAVYTFWFLFSDVGKQLYPGKNQQLPPLPPKEWQPGSIDSAQQGWVYYTPPPDWR